MTDQPSDDGSAKIPVFAVSQARTTRGGQTASWTEAEREDFLNSFKSVSESLAKMLAENEFPQSGFQMETVEVKLGISAKGKVGILGTGAEAAANASLTVTFKRREVT